MYESRFVETLLELHRTGRTCIVRLECGDIRKQLALSKGNLAFAESNVPGEHLAHVMVRVGLIEQKDLQQISALMKGGKAADEAVEMATGLDVQRLQEGVLDQALTILASLLVRSDSRVRVFEGNGSSRRRYPIALPIPQALMQAARRAAKGEAPPASCNGKPACLVPDPKPGLKAGLPLNGAEAYAYGQVQKPTPLASLIPLLAPGDARPEEQIQSLLLVGLLQIVADTPEQNTSAGQQEALLTDKVDEMLRHFEVGNYYEILSVPPNAREDQIKTAYHEMARQYHPDRFEAKGYSPNFRARVERLFTYVTAAYTTLGDHDARAVYDGTRLKQESKVESTLQGRAAADADKEKMAALLFRAGLASLKNREVEKAVQQLQECVWLQPDNARYHHFLGVAKSEIAAQRKAAEQHFLKAISLEKMSPDTYVQLGKLYLRVNLHKRAEAQFVEALRWDAENAEALKLLASLQPK